LWGVPKQSSAVSGVTRGLSQGGQSLAEGGPLAKTQKLRNDNESLDVYTS